MIKINLFKKEKSFKKKDFTFHSNFYWRIILLCTTIIIILSFIFSYNLYIQISEEPVLPIENNDGQFPLVNKDRIDKVLNYFSEREKKSIEILNSPASVVDPSL
jgi:cell division protein FtsW (lipid II flippase)